MRGLRREGRTLKRAGFAIAVVVLGAAAAAVNARETAPDIRYEVLASYPHDRTSFTQGLVYLQGKLFESAGQYGQSDVRMSDLESGRVLARQPLSAQLFAEGLARIGQRLYQLTWRAGTGIVYRLPFLKPEARFEYSGEGWGLAYDGRRLIMSDGSDTLRFLDPASFAVTRRLKVQDGTQAVDQLNELEFADKLLYANVWRQPRIARIDPANGRVTGWLQLQSLIPSGSSVGVLNGIAWDPDQRRLLVTGKNWPRIFALKLLD